jgi:hypothetical protein
MRFLATTIAAVMTAVMASTMMVNAFAAGPAMGTTGECNEYDATGIDLENAAVKPTLSLSRIELPINEAKENHIVTIELTVSGADGQYASTGLHISYDERLDLVMNKKNKCATLGPAGEYLMTGVRKGLYPNDFFVYSAAEGNYGYDGVLWTFQLQLPENIEVGDKFPVEILYRNENGNNDSFKNAEGQGNAICDQMEAWVFTNGIEQGYIEITEAVQQEDPVEAHLGDIDGDNKINASDATRILGAFSALSTGGETGFTDDQLAWADINKDKKVDAKDATVALGYYGYTSTGGTATISEFMALGL